MQGLVALALLLVPLVNARPQYPGTVICDQTPVTAFTYENQGHKEVTEDTGDKGWVNYDAQTCTAYGQSCDRTEETSITKEISVDFGGGAAFDLAKAVNAGLDFGVSVAYSTTKTEATSGGCPASDNDDPCVCGLQYQEFRQESWGTKHSTNACGKEVSEDFDVTAPIKIGDKPRINWRPCRSVESKCKTAESIPLCADGL